MLAHLLFGLAWLSADDRFINAPVSGIALPHVRDIECDNVVGAGLRHPLAHPQYVPDEGRLGGFVNGAG